MNEENERERPHCPSGISLSLQTTFAFTSQKQIKMLKKELTTVVFIALSLSQRNVSLCTQNYFREGKKVASLFSDGTLRFLPALLLPCITLTTKGLKRRRRFNSLSFHSAFAYIPLHSRDGRVEEEEEEPNEQASAFLLLSRKACAVFCLLPSGLEGGETLPPLPKATKLCADGEGEGGLRTKLPGRGRVVFLIHNQTTLEYRCIRNIKSLPNKLFLIHIFEIQGRHCSFWKRPNQISRPDGKEYAHLQNLEKELLFSSQCNRYSFKDILI